MHHFPFQNLCSHYGNAETGERSIKFFEFVYTKSQIILKEKSSSLLEKELNRKEKVVCYHCQSATKLRNQNNFNFSKQF